MTLSFALQALMTGIYEGSVYALVALGFNIIYNSTGVVNFTQGEFVVIGGIAASFFVNEFSMPIILAGPLAVLIVIAVAAVFERTAIYPMRKASVLTLIIITLGGAILLRGLVMVVFGKNAFFLEPFFKAGPIKFLGTGISVQVIVIFGTMVVLSLLLLLFLRLTVTGKAMRACSYNPEAAKLVGVHVQRMVMLSFIISAAIAGIGGVVLIPLYPMMYYYGAFLALKGFAAAVLGGLGRGGGAILGGLAIGLAENFAKYKTTEYKDAIAILLLLVVLFVKPSGILGKAAEERYKKI